MVEHLAVNQGAVGSSPTLRAYGSVAKLVYSSRLITESTGVRVPPDPLKG